MRRQRRAKIVATLGPATNNRQKIEELFLAGADVFRINMSHSNHESMAQTIKMIRELEVKLARPIGILADLQGPKLRIGTFMEGAIELEAGAHFQLDSDTSPGDNTRVFLPHPEILSALHPGHKVLIDDGKVALHILEADSQKARAIVDIGGRISNRKGVSLPDTEIATSAMTQKDHADLEAVLAQGVDWIAISFVQRAEDVEKVKKIVGSRAAVMAKIEKPQAVTRLDDIIRIADGIMVARGDLGVEMPIEKVPGLQKRMTRLARQLGKPIVVATQMLESMITSPIPTRAEVSDVSTAVFEGADAVMLSAESASGRYPLEAVQMMNRITEEVENDPVFGSIIRAQRNLPEPTGADAIAIAARDIAETLDVKAIVAWTASGATALRIARERPQTPILALTPYLATARRLALIWGAHALVTEDARDISDMSHRACEITDAEGFALKGDRILIVAGVPFGTPGATNMAQIAYIGS